MIPSAKYPAKVLLFGEYSILAGSEALAFPYPKFSGYLRYACVEEPVSEKAQKSQQMLIKLFEYLDQNSRKCTSRDVPDIERLRNDIISGLYFDSDIPKNYGIGSSGALAAAVYDSYFDQTKKRASDQIIKCLSLVESYFHQESSGIDPFVSLYSQSVHVRNAYPRSVTIDMEWVSNNLNIFLIDSGIEASTKDGVKKEYTSSINSEYLKLNNSIILSILNKDPEKLYNSIQDLSKQQLDIFTELFPENIMKLAKAGLSDQEYSIKLCGSGGGGYFLMFTKSKKIPKLVKDSGMKVISLLNE